jgi:hypothetical protein
MIVVTSQASEYLSDTITWSGNIELNADQFFTQQQTLQILPGTVVTATGPYKIEIRGNIIAEGTFENPILFTAADTTGLCDSATIAGGWHGFHLLDNPNGEAHFKHCTFEYGKANVPGSWFGSEGSSDNLEGNQGGAFRITGYQTITFDYCNFYNNYARTKGGAMYCRNAHDLIFTHCDFTQNKVLAYGGVIYYYDYIYNLLIEHCIFKRNIAWSETSSGHIFSHGAALYITSPGPPETQFSIRNNYFFNNTSLTTLALHNIKSSVVNNVFTNNFNRQVLTFNLLQSEHFAYNNIIANNYYNYSGIPGVGSFSRQLHFYNNILWNNFSEDIAEDDMALTWLSVPPDVQYCLVWEGRIDGENIIEKDPLFANPAPGYGLDYNGWEYDWSLVDESPAINTGTPDTTGLNLPAFDLAGNPRVFGGRVDMGAYENQNVWVSLPNNPLVNARVQVSPNPFGQSFKVIAPGNEKISSISLFNQNGQQISTGTMMPFEQMLVFDLRNQSPGLYLLVTRFADGNTETTKLVKY